MRRMEVGVGRRTAAIRVGAAVAGSPGADHRSRTVSRVVDLTPCRCRAFAGTVWLSAVLAFAAPGVAAPTPAAQAEIDHLLGYLGGSGCEFYRNGTWSTATKARIHLQKKLDYLLKKDLVDSAEQFIERAASESSRSGEAYRVRCPGAAQTPSARWLADELARYRSGHIR